MTYRHLVVTSATALLLLGVTHAQQPTFQVDVNLIEVDTTVTDADGNAVADLSMSDFEIFDNGQPQKIQTFSWIDIPLTPRAEFPGVDRPVMSDARSNREPLSGRMYLLVLDDMSISAVHDAAVRQQARDFIQSYVGAGDIAGVAYTSGRIDASQEFTGDVSLLLASVDKFKGRRGESAAMEAAEKYRQDRLSLYLDPGPVPDHQIPHVAADMQETRKQILGSKPSIDIKDFERAQRDVVVLNTLRHFSEALAAMSGRRKALLMFSEGLNYQMDEPFGMRSVSDVLNATRDAIAMAARSNVTFYTIDPRGLTGATTDFMQMTGTGIPVGSSGKSTQTDIMKEFRVSQDSLRRLAEETGGFAALDSNSFASAFDRIVDSNSRYYVLGYAPPTDSQGDRFHQIEVRVKKPGLKVTARKGYVSRTQTAAERAKEEAAARARQSLPGADSAAPQLRHVLPGSQQTGLGMSVHAAPFRSTDKEASVALTIEVEGDHLSFVPPGKLEVSFYGVNDEGRPTAGVRKELDLALKPETVERVKEHGLRLNPRISLAPGKYQLRVGARDTVNGERGSVFYDLTVPDFRKEPLTMSGLLVTSVSAQQSPTAEPDPAVSKQIPGAATSRRDFPVGDTLAVYAEVYDNIATKQRGRVDVAVRVISAAGEDVFNATDSMETTAGEPANVFAQFALEDLDPGTYLLRVEAKRSESDAAPIARETLITVH